MKLSAFIIMASCFVLLGCNSLFAQSTDTFRLDIDNLMAASGSQIFDSVDYIPLETNKASSFNNIDKMLLTSHFIFILDSKSDAIFIFRLSGNFYSKIEIQKALKGSGVRKHRIHDFIVNEKDSSVIISDNDEILSLFVFDFNGHLKKTVKKWSWGAFGNIDEKSYLMETLTGDINDSVKGLSGNCLVVGSDLTSIKKYILNKVKTTLTFSGRPITNVFNQDGVFYTRSFDYSIYNIDRSGIFHKDCFIFPLVYTLPKNIMEAPEDKRLIYISKENPKVISNLSDAYKIGNTLFFSFHNIEKGTVPVVYNMKTENGYSLGEIRTDSIFNLLPFYSFDGITPTPKILACDTNSVYLSVPSYQLLQYYTYYKKKSNFHYSKKIENGLSSLNRLSNPVLIRVWPREIF